MRSWGFQHDAQDFMYVFDLDVNTYRVKTTSLVFHQQGLPCKVLFKKWVWVSA